MIKKVKAIFKNFNASQKRILLKTSDHTIGITTISKKWVVLICMSFLIFLGNFDFTAVLLAIPKISSEFNANIRTVQWILVSYIITSAAFILTNRHFCNFIGKRKTFFLGCGIFALSSLIAALSTDVKLLIFSRFIQGIGYALAFPLIYSFVFDAFPPNQRGTSMGFLHFTTAVAQASGPFLGGMVIEWIGWRTIFFVNIPICVLAGCLMYGLSSSQKKNKEKFSYPLIVNLFIGLSSLILIMFSLNFFDSFLPKVFCFLLSIALFIIFLLLEKKSDHPLSTWSIFNNIEFTKISVIRFLIQIVFTEFFLLPGLFLQNDLLKSPAETGSLYLIMTLVFAFTALVGGKSVDKIGAKAPLTLGLIFLILSSSLFCFFFHSPSHILLFSGFFTGGLGLGLTFPASLYIAMHSASEEDRPTASSFFLMIALIGCSVGASVSSFYLNFSAKVSLKNFILGMNNLSPRHLSALHNLLSGANAIRPENLRFLDPAQLKVLTTYAAQPFFILMAFNAIFMLIGLMLAMQLKTPGAVQK